MRDQFRGRTRPVGAGERSRDDAPRAPGKRTRSSQIQRRSKPARKRSAGEESLTKELEQAPGIGLGVKAPITRSLLDWIGTLQGIDEGQSAESGSAEDEFFGGGSGNVREVEGTPFVQGGGDEHAVSPNDAKQGALGDCYFIAALTAIAAARPELIREMVQDNGDGTYTVTFQTLQGFSGIFGNRSAEEVTVDSRFIMAGDEPKYAKTGDTGDQGPELWVMIIEKAWATLHGGYEEIEGSRMDSDARASLTGHTPDYYVPADEDPQELLALLDEHFNAAGMPIIMLSAGDEKEFKDWGSHGIIENHEYVVMEVDAEGGTVSLRNPWGRKHIPYLPIEAVRECFRKVRLVKLSGGS